MSITWTVAAGRSGSHGWCVRFWLAWLAGACARFILGVLVAWWTTVVDVVDAVCVWNMVGASGCWDSI
ncbi:MAG: hypothetical protein IJU61_16535 [Victivallales bacterium]|nr:hypothetical protein [Victivallales bacterium]